MYDNILVPTDGTPEARVGTEHALELAAAVGATIHTLYVIKLPGAPRTVYISSDEEEVRKEYRQYGEEVTEAACKMATRAGVDCQTAVRNGSIHEEIADYAEEEDIDLIVMGTGYRGRFGAIMGGTAEKIVRTAEVPVTTIRTRVNGHS